MRPLRYAIACMVAASLLTGAALAQLGKNDRARDAWTRVRDLAAGKPEHARIAAEATEALGRLTR